MKCPKKCSKIKILLLALAFCCVFSSVFAETLTAEYHNHEGGETFCLICLIVETSKSLKLASVAVFFVSSLIFSALIPKTYTGFDDYPLSPVVLKVRSNS